MLDKNLSWYFDKENIPAQDKLVVPTYNYFQEGPGKEFFKPLDFLNLLRKQYQELVNYLDSPLDFIIHTKSIPLTPRELHILYGFILKWFGGYPVHNLNEEFDKILKIIQKEFLNFEGPTPEKEFCKVDFEKRKEFMKLSIAATTAINTGVDLKIIYDGLTGKAPVEKISFSTFPDMFETAYNNNAFGPYNNEIEKLINRDKYNLEFNIWLQEKEYWSYGDEDGYKSFLTKERFLEFLQYEQAEKAKKVEIQRKESATWVVNKNEIKPTTKSKLDFTKDKLEVIVKELAVLNGYSNPSPFLDDLLNDVQSFNDFDFTCNFFLNIHYLCQANAELFWNDSHKKDITSWLQKAPIITDVFLTTWSSKKKFKTPEKGIVTNKYTIPTYALMHVYLAMFGGQAVSPQNKNELAKKYGHNSGAYLRNKFTLFQNEDKRLDISTSNRRSANEHLNRFRDILPHLSDNPKAYQKAKEDLAFLEKEYRKHH